MFGNHLIKSWSSIQAAVSLSSGEAEYYNMVKGGPVGFGIHAMMRDFRFIVHLTFKCDASAAMGIVMRRGFGKVRHIDVPQLWLQRKVAQGIFRVVKVKSNENKNDALIKHIGNQEISKHMAGTGQSFINENHGLH